MPRRLYRMPPSDAEIEASLGLAKLNDRQLRQLSRQLRNKLAVVTRSLQDRLGTRTYECDRQDPRTRVIHSGSGSYHSLFDHLRTEVDKDGKKVYVADSFGFGRRRDLEALLKIIDAGWRVSIDGYTTWVPGATTRLTFTPPEKTKRARTTS
jgi:hypothetical protein